MLILSKRPGVPTGQQEFTAPGSHTWVCPPGVFSVSVVCVGGGSSRDKGGAGGGLGYKNNIAVVPGQSYSLTVGAGGPASTTTAGGDSYFSSPALVKGGGGQATYANGVVLGGDFVGDGGGNGGKLVEQLSAGSGAGGYSGDGGKGAYSYTSSQPGAGGGGGGGAMGKAINDGVTMAPGGGVGLFGQGANGAAGIPNSSNYGTAGGGGGGSSGVAGTDITSGMAISSVLAGLYGGGGGCAPYGGIFTATAGASGAVRVIWPGDLRQFPSTRTADE